MTTKIAYDKLDASVQTQINSKADAAQMQNALDSLQVDFTATQALVTEKAQEATSSAAEAAAAAATAIATANSIGTLYTTISNGDAPPYKVTGINITAGGTATTIGRFTGNTSGLVGFAWSYLTASSSGISAPVWNNVLTKSNTPPALTASNGGVSGATAVATMGQLTDGDTFWAISSDGKSRLLWQVSGAAVTVFNGPDGSQIMDYSKAGVDAAINALNITQTLGAPEFSLFYKGDKSKWMKITPTQFLHPVIDALGAAVSTLQSTFSSFGSAAQKLTTKTGPTEFSLYYNSDKTRWFSVTPTAIQHPAIDNLNTAIATLQQGGSGGSYMVRDSKWDSIQLISETPHFEGYGQSLMLGYPGALYSTGASNFSYMFSGGVRPDDLSTDPATIYASLIAHQERYNTSGVADSSANAVGQSVGETPMYGAMQMLAQLLRDNEGTDPASNGQKPMVSVSARGGAPVALLTKANGTRYQRLLANLQNGPVAAAALGKSYASGALLIAQGEGDSVNKTSYTDYKNGWLGILTSVQSDWQAAAGTQRPVPMIFYQTSSTAGSAGTSTYYNGAEPVVPIAQLQMALENDYVAHSSPTFFMQHRSNDVHLQPIGTKWMGAYMGWVIYQWLYKGYKPQPLRPVIRAEGSQIIARYPVLPGRKLVIDSSTIELMPNFGMRAFNAAGVEKTLSNPRLVGRDCVVWTASETPADVWNFGYAWSAQTAAGRTILNGGNIRDDNPLIFDPTDMNKPMYRWAPIDKIALTA